MCYGNPDVYPKVIDVHKKHAKRLVYKEVEGTHHLHLVTPERISGMISEFIS